MALSTQIAVGTAAGSSSASGAILDSVLPASTTRQLGNLGWGGGGYHDDHVERGRTRLWERREEEREELREQLQRAFGLALDPEVSDPPETPDGDRDADDAPAPVLVPQAMDAIAKAAVALVDAVPAFDPVAYIAEQLPIWQAQADWEARAAAEQVLREAEEAHARHQTMLDEDDDVIALLLAS